MLAPLKTTPQCQQRRFGPSRSCDKTRRRRKAGNPLMGTAFWREPRNGFFWCNNNFDRWDYDPPFDTPEQDSVESAGCQGAPFTVTPDYNYLHSDHTRVIPCTRDLEDFARLWICGVTTNLLAALPAGSTITLNWGDVGHPNSANPTIDLFQPADADGGIGYLTNETTAQLQIDSDYNPYIGRLGPGSNLVLNASQFNGWLGNHFIWCGVANGKGGLNLTFRDANSNLLTQATAYIQIVDIKNLFERWTVGDNSSVTALTTAVLATEGLRVGDSAFLYQTNGVTNTPYILLVHGYNMPPWAKDCYGETAYKRLYWQGYQGRFGEFNWPTAQNPLEFGSSELQAWQSAQGLLNKLEDLNATYPGQVYLMAHSLGNVVAGEALRLATNQVVNTYLAMQAAVTAHAYDPTTPIYYLLNDSGTPDCYAHYWNSWNPCYFNASAGAGTYINFYNTNDFALNLWLVFQNSKPTLNPTYTFIPPEYYYHYLTTLNFPGNTYEIFDKIIQARSYALGMQTNVGGVFHNASGSHEVNLQSIWPADPLNNYYKAHVWHSAEFRSDNPQRWLFWDAALVQMGLKSSL